VPASGEFDVIVNAMVINCVETPEKRGKMLLLLHKHLKNNGTLMLSLPRRCIEQTPKSNSKGGQGKKYRAVNGSPSMSKDILFRILNLIGFEIENCNASPKILFICAVKKKDIPNKSALCGLFGSITDTVTAGSSQQKYHNQEQQHKFGSSGSFAIQFTNDSF